MSSLPGYVVVDQPVFRSKYNLDPTLCVRPCTEPPINSSRWFSPFQLSTASLFLCLLTNFVIIGQQLPPLLTDDEQTGRQVPDASKCLHDLRADHVAFNNSVKVMACHVAHPMGACRPRLDARVRRASPSRSSSSRDMSKKSREKAVSFADMFPLQDSAPGHSRNSADGKSRRSCGLCSERPFRQRSAVEWSR